MLMKTLLVGFDSAWTQNNFGALVGAIQHSNGTLKELDLPQVVNFRQAEKIVHSWQDQEMQASTIVLIDQPTIVRNGKGQRPVENIVASPVSRRRGGIQPANTGRIGMFDSGAPIWGFLASFCDASDPYARISDTAIFETYPVLAMIALGWTLPDKKSSGRLPKYNPKRRKTFSFDDWRFVCDRVMNEINKRKLPNLRQWIYSIKSKQSPNKKDQDCLDACICLLVALYLCELKECLMVGNMKSGYIVVPNGDTIRKELRARCKNTNCNPLDWVRPFRLELSGNSVRQIVPTLA